MNDNFFMIYQENFERLKEEVRLGTEEGKKEWKLYQEIEKTLGNHYFENHEAFEKMFQLVELTKSPFYQMMLDRMKEDRNFAEGNLSEIFENYGVLNEEVLKKIMNYCKAKNEILRFKERFKLFHESDGWGKLALFGIREAYYYMWYYF